MKKELPPLFYLPQNGELNPLKAVVTDKSNGKKYNPKKLIEKIVTASSEDIEDILDQKEFGTLVMATNILLETLHEVGLGDSIGHQILTNPNLLYTYGLICSIGLTAGRAIPEEVEFNHEKEKSSDPVLRALIQGGKDIQAS